VQKNKHEKIALVVVNLNKSVAERLAAMFGKKLGELKQFKSFDEFVG
jgi:hypothetical protein